MSFIRKILSKIRDKYRLVIINDSSLGESFSFRLSPLNVIMLLAFITMIIFVIFFLIAKYTPARTLVGGSGGGDPEYMKLNQKIEDLTREIESRQIKQDALTKILSDKEMELDTNQIHYLKNTPPKTETEDKNKK